MNRRRFVSALLASPVIAAAREPEPPNSTVERVLVMFKCHFDAGFVDTQTAVVHRYYTDYFPRAISLAQSLRQSGRDRYIWTTGSWLLYTYLEQAEPAARRRMEQAIERGDIAWHALPFTWQTELLDPSAITGCLGFSQSMDRRFGRTTSGAKMTDVPGHTRGLVAPLAAAGVTFLDIGVNSASTAPDVPPVFLWQDPDGAELIVMYHRLDYGGTVVVPGSKLAVAVEVRDDNSGPHTQDEIRAIYTDLRRQFPNADIRPATLTDIAQAVQPFKSGFPVFKQEIGDTWIHGVASDPTKLSRFRELLRLRAEWIRSGTLKSADPADLAFLQNFALAAEHTWGTDTKTWLDFNHYTPAALAGMLNQPKYKVVTGSWIEKRRDIDAGVAALEPTLRAQAQSRLLSLAPNPPSLSGIEQVRAGQLIETSYFRIGIDPVTGAITHCENKQNGKNVAAAQNPLALFCYQTLSQADYDRFLAAYITKQTDWAPKDFGKPNIAHFGAQSRVWSASSTNVRQVATDKLIVELNFPHQASDAVTAWPSKAYLAIDAAAPGRLLLDFSFFGKRANRMPEALWLTFNPKLANLQNWTLSKTGLAASPFDVVSNGNRHMHALTGPLSHPDLAIKSLDAAVVALDTLSPFPFSNQQPDLANGFHFSLYNNAWGTNYIQWFGEDARFRFQLTFS